MCLVHGLDSLTWTDSDGNLWLFGGKGAASSGYLNDLWRYDLETNMWTWMSGSNTADQECTYGTQGIPDAANVPGGRDGRRFLDRQCGNLWLFGGYGGFVFEGFFFQAKAV